MHRQAVILFLLGLLGERAPLQAAATFYEDNPTYMAPPDTRTWERGTPESQAMNSAMLEAGASMLQSRPETLSFIVLRNGAIIFERYFNGSQATHSHNIHSASKSLLSGLVGIALSKGYLSSLDQTIGDILPPKYAAGNVQKTISVRELLTMTTGLDWTEDETEYQIEKEPDRIAAILSLKQKSPKKETWPRWKFGYSTAATHLLSAVLTEVSGMDLCEFARLNVFAPMAITFEHWGRDPQGYCSGGYNLYMTPRNLAKLGQLYLQAGNWEGKSIIPSGWIRESVTPLLKVGSTKYSYGYLWWLYSTKGRAVYKMWGHGGQFVFIVPSLSLVAVLTSDTKIEYSPWDKEDEFLDRYVISAAVAAN